MEVKYCLINNNLYAHLDLYSYTLCFNNGIWEEDIPIELYPKDEIRYILKIDAAKIFKDKSPYDLLVNKYKEYLKKEEYYKNDSLKRFIDDFILYAIDDYYNHIHNKDDSLRYSAYELDEHYEICGYVSFLNNYYEEYLRRKNEFNNIIINKLDDDYIIVFNKNILK